MSFHCLLNLKTKKERKKQNKCENINNHNQNILTYFSFNCFFRIPMVQCWNQSRNRQEKNPSFFTVPSISIFKQTKKNMVAYLLSYQHQVVTDVFLIVLLRKLETKKKRNKDEKSVCCFQPVSDCCTEIHRLVPPPAVVDPISPPSPSDEIQRNSCSDNADFK